MGYWKVNRNRDKSKPIFERRLASVVFEKTSPFLSPPPSQFGTVVHNIPIGRFWITDSREIIPIDSSSGHELKIQDRVRKSYGIGSLEEMKYLMDSSRKEYRGDPSRKLLDEYKMTEEDLSVASGKSDGSDYAIRKWGWVRVHDNYIEVMATDSITLSNIKEVLESIYGVRACRKFKLTVEIIGPYGSRRRQILEDVPFEDLVSGSHFGDYRDPSSFGKYAQYGMHNSVPDKFFWINSKGDILPCNGSYHASVVINHILKNHGVEYIDRSGSYLDVLKNKYGLTPNELSVIKWEEDPSNYAIDNWGWVRVNGRDIETYSLTSQLLNTLTTALESMYGEAACENTLFNMEVHSPRNFFVDVPYHVLKSGSGLGRYKEGFGKFSQVSPPAKKFWITGKGKIIDVYTTHYDTALEYLFKKIVVSKEFVTNVRHQNIPDSLLKEKYGLSDYEISIVRGSFSALDYLMKNEGWIRVSGHDLNVDTLDSKTRNLIDKGLRKVYGDACESLTLNVEVRGTGHYFEQVPFQTLISGSGLGKYRDTRLNKLSQLRMNYSNPDRAFWLWI